MTTTAASMARLFGNPANAPKIATLRQLVLQAPAPVIDQSLGFHKVTTHRHNMATGGVWKTYSATHFE